ncbi:cytochrome c oxidase assembly protein [Rhizobium grahamii]|uniref:Cytochrome c oxidase assembly protein n=1 Tax=Rhizobium grahamii CCGE 502 TaxID=990285 RepID=S3HCK7_9HYPH|nr:cytochrome c oxidase assembly protein [Rhizobium grahamii]EPE96462.1 hypothetical protein RGCCGE502_19970 [Rhizobium grahamii CCGE 502]
MSALIAIYVFITPCMAMAHGVEPHRDLSWTFDPWIVLPLASLSILYVAGTITLSNRRHSGFGRTLRGPTLFWSGVATLVVALVSPLHELGERLFTVHMIEHELVMAAAAPLFVLSKPIGVLLWGMPRKLRQLVGEALGNRLLQVLWQVITVPLVATLLHGLAVWSWHLPALFDATVSNSMLHRLQHLSFFLTGLVFWWAVIWHCAEGAAAWHLLITMMHTTILGALITFAPTVLYIAQTRFTADWGITSLEDQQLAGIIMWVPGGMIYGGAALWLLALWINRSSKGGKNAPRFDVV